MAKDSVAKGLLQYDARVSLGSAIPFGLQHILAMFVSNITPIVIIAGVSGVSAADVPKLIQSALLIAGIGTLIQVFPLLWVGARLPAVMGTSFAFVSILCYVGSTYGMETMLGSILIGGLVEGVLGLLARFWIRIIKPVVSASVVTAVGLTLLPVGAKSFGGGEGAADFGSWQNWVIGGVTLLVCLLFFGFGTGLWKSLSTLIGLGVGYVLAVCMGMVDFSVVTGSEIVGLPAFFTYGMKFDLSAILSVTCIFLVSATDAIGCTSAIADGGYRREVTKEEIRGSISCCGFVSAIGAMFGAMPITVYSQNVGLVAMTGVVNRIVFASGAAVLVLAGFFPIFGNVLSTIPEPVLGGCTIMVFGMIVVTGISMLAKAGFTERNIVIMALALAIGVGFTQVPKLFDVFPAIVRNIFAENSVAVVFIVAIFLNLLLPRDKEPTKQS
ncbi:MAG: nucleobase:cation symporter-2 family protein [Eubacterium sp.]|nr:nucleobase:cation symporter-2 family protein [Eubacterium sp.]